MATIVPTDATIEQKQEQKTQGPLVGDADSQQQNRLWAGNLPFKTSEEELRDLFSEFTITDVSLPRRFGRSQGFAFITFAEGTNMDAALERGNSSSLDGRELRTAKATSTGPYPSGQADGEERGQRPERRGRGGRRNGLPRRRNGPSDEEGSGAQEGSPVNVPGQAAPLAESSDEARNAANAVDSQRTDRGPRTPRRKGPPENGIESQTTIYVANIPYEFTDDDLKELFAGCNPESAHIVPRPLPKFIIRKLAERGEQRKGRGFGFVTFADSAAQHKAVEEFNGKEFQGRPLIVKIAIDKPEVADGEGAADEGEGQA